MVLAALPVCGAWAGPLPPVHTEQDIPAQALERPVVVYNRPYTGAIYGDYVPDVHEVEAPFAPAMARNEYEPMQVGLYIPKGKAALKNVTLEVKCTVPFRVGHIYYTPVEELSWMADTSESLLKTNFPNMNWPVDPKRLVNKRSSLPLYVLPVPSIRRIEPGRSAAFWVTFHTDETVPAGTHEGTLHASADGTDLKTIPFTLTVYPFGLPRPKVRYGMYYLPYQTPAAFQGRSFQKLYLADMAAHGMNFLDMSVHMELLAEAGYDWDSSTPVGPPEHNAWNSVATRRFLDNYLAPQDYEPDGGYNALKMIEAEVRMGVEAGLIQRDQPCVAFASGFSMQNKAIALATMQRHGACRDWPHFMQYMRDEPGPKVFDEVNEHVSEWRRMGVTGIAAMSGLAAFVTGPAHHVCTVLTGQITPQLLLEAERLGVEVWTYDYNLRVTNAEASRFNAGLYTWSLRLKGNMPYAYMDYGNQDHPVHFDVNWRLSEPSGLGFVVPSPAGPVPGVGFEGWREGIDDLRYLQLLEARLAPLPAGNPVAEEAVRWLTSVRVRSQMNQFHTVGYNAWPSDFLDPHDGLAAGDYGAIRAKAAAFIARLPSAPGEMNPQPKSWLRMKAEPMEADAFANAGIADCMTALRTGTTKQKRQAAAALAMREAGDVLPARELLMALLEEPEVRVVALRALARLGPQAAPAIPALGKLLVSEDAFIRVGVTYVLTRIGPAAVDLISVCTDDPDLGVASLASEWLVELSRH